MGWRLALQARRLAEKRDSVCQRMSADDLPAELLTHALSYLKPKELAQTLSTSNKMLESGEEALSAMPEPKKHRVKLVSGDSTGDGHGHSTDFTIMSSLSRDELQSAYYEGCKKLNFDVQHWSIDNKVLPAEECAKFERHGLQMWGEEEEGGVRVDACQRDLPILWLFTAKLGAPQLEYEFTADKRIDIGGWGLWEDW